MKDLKTEFTISVDFIVQIVISLEVISILLTQEFTFRNLKAKL